MAAKLSSPDVRLRYLDACAPNGQVRARLAYAGLEFRNLGLEDVSTNILLGAGDNRLIIKQSKCRSRAFTPDDVPGLHWLAQCRCVRANSVKHIDVAEFLAAEAMSGSIDLHIVPTPYLPPDFIASRWLPAASEICTSQDEIVKVMGWDVGPSLSEASAVIARLQTLAPRAIILLTRGEDGVVVTMPGQTEPVHVRLERNWDKVQALVVEDPTALCGAGDACATGSTLFLHLRRSVLGDMDGDHPLAVRAAIAGSALALKWIGWRPAVHYSDFSIRCLPVPVTAAAA